jgi:hypothetical protein
MHWGDSIKNDIAETASPIMPFDSMEASEVPSEEARGFH